MVKVIIKAKENQKKKKNDEENLDDIDVDKINFEDLNKVEERVYDQLNNSQLEDKNEEKSNLLLKINKAKENLVQKLSDLVKKLNQLVSDNSKILYRKDDPIILEQLNKAVNIRQKDLNISKKINKTLKEQYKNLKQKLLHEQSKENIIKIYIRINLIIQIWKKLMKFWM